MPTKLPKPAPLKPATWEEVEEAFAQGDADTAADRLRRLDGVGPSELSLIADLLTGEGKLFAYRLKLVKRGRGRPTDLVKRRAEDFIIRRLFESARSKWKYESAIQNVAEKTKLSRSTIIRALGAAQKVKKPHSQ